MGDKQWWESVGSTYFMDLYPINNNKLNNSSNKCLVKGRYIKTESSLSSNISKNTFITYYDYYKHSLLSESSLKTTYFNPLPANIEEDLPYYNERMMKFDVTNSGISFFETRVAYKKTESKKPTT